MVSTCRPRVQPAAAFRIRRNLPGPDESACCANKQFRVELFRVTRLKVVVAQRADELTLGRHERETAVGADHFPRDVFSGA